MRVAALTGGKNVPSARFRVRQLIPYLHQAGIHVTEFVPRFSRYPPSGTSRRLVWGTAAIIERLPTVVCTHRYDMTLLQRELLSTLVSLEPFTKRPRVLDVDDAIFTHRQGNTARRLAKLVDLIICGNDFLAEYFSRWNTNVVIIPTGVDTSRFSPMENGDEKSIGKSVVGWIGTSGNFKYLYQIRSALEKVIRQHDEVVLRVVADRAPRFKGILEDRLEFIKWSPFVEAQSIQSMTIGLMPLADGFWERGKCAYKMLQYMSCGIPVVASPVGMNAQVLSLGNVGFPAKEENDWVESLSILLMNKSLRDRMGEIGRSVVEKNFSLGVVSELVAKSLSPFK